MAKGVKAVYFSTDALLAVAILLVGASTLYLLAPSEQYVAQQYVISNDFLSIMSVLKVSEINNDYVQQLISDGNITNLNNTILMQIGEFWAENKTSLANKMVQNISWQLLPGNLEFGVWIQNDTIYSSGAEDNDNLISSSRMVSGVTKYKPVEGFLTRIFLTDIESKVVNSYYYFGGYVGDGNLSAKIQLPEEYYNVTEVYLELSVNESFDLYVNGDYSGNYIKQYSDDMRASKWYVDSAYFDNFIPGWNNVELNFDDSGSVGGGFIRVDTFSNQTNFTNIQYDGENATKREYLPGIDGILNLYSSFYVPGNLTSLKFHLHFKSNDETFFTVGGSDVYDNNPNGTTTIDLTDVNLTYLNYSNLSQTTVPLRFRLFGSDFLGPGVDSFMVTDVSGSMDECSGVYYNATVCKYEYCSFYFYGCWSWVWTECEYQGTCSNDECNSGTTRTRNHDVENGSLCYSKLDIAKDADKEFVNIILNNSNNKVGLTTYNANLENYTTLTNNNATLISDIINYDAGGGTCVCCGIYKAVDMLPNQRKEFMVVLSDGDANYKCSGPGDYTGTSDSTNAPDSTIDAGQYACSQGITVYTIGFGEGVSAEGTETLKQTACNESLYYNATDTNKLQEIITNISNEILKTSFELQTAVSAYRNSTLYNDSYIEYTYDPVNPPFVFGMIPFTVESNPFNNTISTGHFDILENVTVTDAKVTSYSGNKWTNSLQINNSDINTNVFNLTKYGGYYIYLGDPFYVNIPVGLIREGTNDVTVMTGKSGLNQTGGSVDDRAIYTFLVKSSLGYSALGAYVEGCNWTVQYEGGENGTILVPSNYNGTDNCDFQSASYDAADSLDAATYYVLNYFDLDNDGYVDIDISENSLKIEHATLEKVPSLWGPSVVEVRVWQ